MKKCHINITCQAKDFDNTLKSAIKLAVDTTLEYIAAQEHFSLSILICDDEKIRTLNNTYRGLDSATDVLSFPSGERFPETNEVFLGDIVISYPTTIKQASENQHPVSHELSLLCVHGVLHLLGYDHTTQDDEKVMWQLQKSVLATIGINNYLSGGMSA